MNRRALMMASLASIPASMLAMPAVAAPKKGGGRKPAGGTSAARGKPSGRRQPGGGMTANAARFRTVTRTFTSTVPLTIPGIGTGAATGSPASVYPSTLLVSGLTQGRILKVRASLIGLSHTYPSDLDVMLVAPGNTRGVVLLSDVGGGTDAVGLTLIFDQQAPGRVPDPLVSGTYQPANSDPALDPFPAPAPAGVTGHSLTAFNNLNPNGLWRLYIVDDAPTDSGSLLGWSLTIRARVSVPHLHGRRTNQRQGRRAKK